MKNYRIRDLRPYVPETPGILGGGGRTERELVESALAVLFCIFAVVVLLAAGLLAGGR